jgi:putative transposase
MELTKKQTEQVLSNFLNKENGLNTVLELVLNSMMYNERQAFLEGTEGNKGNGYRLGKVFGHGTELELRVPRDRYRDFQPIILALFRDQEYYLKEVSFQLYSKGLTTRDIGQVMQTIYGKHFSKSTISNFSQSFYEQMQVWRCRKLEQHYLALYIDGIFTKVKRNGVYGNECYYIVLGLKQDYTREVLAIETLPSESSTGWELIFQSLKQRGISTVGLVVSDNLPGLDTAVARQFKTAAHQKCIVHLQRNLQATVRSEDKKKLAEELRLVFAPDENNYTLEKALERLGQLKSKWKGYPQLIGQIDRIDWPPYFTYLNYHKNIRRMIYTTNWIERFNKSIRRTLKIRNSMPSQEAVLALITSVAIDKGNKKYAYPIYNFKFDPKLNNPSKKTC